MPYSSLILQKIYAIPHKNQRWNGFALADGRQILQPNIIIHTLIPLVALAYPSNLNGNVKEQNSEASKAEFIIETDTEILYRIKNQND